MRACCYFSRSWDGLAAFFPSSPEASRHELGHSEMPRPLQHPLNDDRPERQCHRGRQNVRGRHTRRHRRGIAAHGACHHVAGLRGRKCRKEKEKDDGCPHGRERQEERESARHKKRCYGDGNEPLEGGGNDQPRVLPKGPGGEARPDAQKPERKRRIS